MAIRLISTARGLVVCGQISVHTRLQREIGPRLLTAPLCQTDEYKDKKGAEDEPRESCVFHGLNTVMNLKNKTSVMSEKAAVSPAQFNAALGR